MSSILAIFEGALSPMHILVVLIIGVLLFGKRLPEIGRSLGKGLQEFKKGFNGLEDDVHGANPRLDAPPTEAIKPPQKVATTAPKFEDNPPAPPVTPPKA
jgi:sec-independent protein translocase protein TatA